MADPKQVKIEISGKDKEEILKHLSDITIEMKNKWNPKDLVVGGGKKMDFSSGSQAWKVSYET